MHNSVPIARSFVSNANVVKMFQFDPFVNAENSRIRPGDITCCNAKLKPCHKQSSSRSKIKKKKDSYFIETL